jgi:hypothetical protein
MKLSERDFRRLMAVHAVATIGPVAVMYYHAVLFLRAMEWTRELQDRLIQVERQLDALRDKQ